MSPRPTTCRPPRPPSRTARRAHARSSLLLLALSACGGAEAAPKAAATPEPTAHEQVATTAAPAPSVTAAAAPATSSEPAPSASASATTSPLLAPVTRPKTIAARHVLIQWMGCTSAAPSVIRTRDQAHALAEDVLRRVKAGEDFARLVVEFSDEPNAGARGGSVGRFGHGAMVHEFEEAAFALKPGEISAIVESPFGFHVIQRTE
jgi:peptidyl-prolyl cis-trans isomerase NIMA-interacting 1